MLATPAISAELPPAPCDDRLSNVTAPQIRVETPVQKDGYRTATFEFPSPLPSGIAGNDTVHGDLYLPETSGRHPAVVILHNLLVLFNAPFERGLAQSLARSGYVAAFMDLPFHLRRTPPGVSNGALFIRSDLRQTVRNINQAAADASALLRWLSERPDADPRRTGMIGVSIGGFITHLVMGENSRVKAGVTFVAGGDVAGLIWKSNAGVARAVKRRLESRGVTREDAARQLAEVEPTAYAHCTAPCSTLMVNGTDDLIVPRSSAEAMARALGNPPQLWLPTNHFGIILLPNRLYELARDFLDTSFGGKPFPHGRLKRYQIPAVKVGLFTGLESRLTAGMGIEYPLLYRSGLPFLSVEGLWTTRGLFAGLVAPLKPFLEVGITWRIANGRPEPALSLGTTLAF